VTTASDPQAYPAPRAGRGSGAAFQADEPITAPRTRIFPFYMRGTLNRRSTWSTPRLTGPAIIKELNWNGGTPSDPPISTLELGVAMAPVTEAAVVTTTPRAWTVLTELVDSSALIADTAGAGFPASTLPGSLAYQPRALNLVMTEPEFFLVVSFWCNAATGSPITGHLVVLEGVDRESLRFFL
jgi:hypothetical protein